MATFILLEAETENFKSIQSRFQTKIEDNNAKAKPFPRPKPTIPTKVIVGPSTGRYFERPIPKAFSSPELPVPTKRCPVKNGGYLLNSDQRVACQSNSRTQLKTPGENFKDNIVNKPVIPAKPLTVKPSTNFVKDKNTVEISLKTPSNFNQSAVESCKIIPKVKLLPSKAILGPKPLKPARPPFVDLEKFMESNDSNPYVIMRSNPACLRLSASQPNLSPSPSIWESTEEEEGVYENVLLSCSVKKKKCTSLQNFVIPETSAQDEIYDEVEFIAERRKPPLNSISSTETNILITDWRNDTNLKKMEKLEMEFRKRFQFHGEIKVISRMMVDPNAPIQKAGNKDLPYTRGEIVDVIQLTNAEKILCRNFEGRFGYIPRKSVLKLEKAKFDNLTQAVKIGSSSSGSGSKGTESKHTHGNIYHSPYDVLLSHMYNEIYDDTELISSLFPAVPSKPRFQHSYVTRMFQRNTSQLRKKSTQENQGKENVKKIKNLEKEMKELKKKFKIEGDIKVLTRMMVVPSAGNKRGGGKELPISKGEILEVIQFTNQEKILCRNSDGKYGYVKRRYVLQPFGSLVSIFNPFLTMDIPASKFARHPCTMISPHSNGRRHIGEAHAPPI
ncbi:FYN-binding protein 1-like [Pelodytes ibericus]